MKTELKKAARRGNHGPLTRKSESGLATAMFIILLAIMVLLATAESRALIHLHREVGFLEQQQIKRLAVSQTNAVPATLPISEQSRDREGAGVQPEYTGETNYFKSGAK